MLITVLAENRSKKEMLERKCVSRPKFRIQRVKYSNNISDNSISSASFTVTLEQQRSENAWGMASVYLLLMLPLC